METIYSVRNKLSFDNPQMECYGLLPFVTFPPIIKKPNVHAGCYALLRLLRLEIPWRGGRKGKLPSPSLFPTLQSAMRCRLPLSPNFAESSSHPAQTRFKQGLDKV